MKLSNDEWLEILKHLRSRTREAGLLDLDDELISDFRTTEKANLDFLRYLDSLISALAERSYSGYQQALNAFSNCVQTENNAPVQGIEIIVKDTDVNLFHKDRIDLGDFEDIAPLIISLKKLRGELYEEGLFNEQEGD